MTTRIIPVSPPHDGLTPRWQARLERWSLVRRRAWKITDRWSVPRLMVTISKVRAGLPWRSLEGADVELQHLDAAIRHMAGTDCRTQKSHETRTEALRRRAQMELPGFRLTQLRHLLAREARGGTLGRAARTEYLNGPRAWGWCDDEGIPIPVKDQGEYAYWEGRLWQWRKQRADVLLCHFLLPHLSVRKKGHALRLSGRDYRDRLADALDYLDWL